MIAMDLSNLRSCIQNNPLRYRSILTIPRDVKFGLEIELENVKLDTVSKSVHSLVGRDSEVKVDDSLIKGLNAEVALPPLVNVKDTWILLRRLGELLERLKPTFEHCSLQVNLDGSLLPSSRDRIKFLKLFAVYEDIVYRFSRGENLSIRDNILEYAYPIILSLKTYKDFDDFDLYPFINQKRYGINFKMKDKDLIEFRSPNGTINIILWQNYITFFYYLVMYSLSDKCREDELDEYLDRFNKTYILENYELAKDEKAFDLSKKLFKKSDDRTFFMSQYMGVM